MAGIAGIIAKNKKGVERNLLVNALKEMLIKLSSDYDQKNSFITAENCSFGNVALKSSRSSENFLFNKAPWNHCIIDGQVYIDKEEKLLIHKNYNIGSDLQRLMNTFHGYITLQGRLY